MTDIWIISDVHDDYSRGHFGRYDLPKAVPADILVLAGDVAGRLSKATVDWLFAQDLDMPVVVVPGNHDFYHGSLDTEVAKARARLPSHVHVLDGDEVTIQGVRFVGGTLWTDFAVTRDFASAMRVAEGGMNDYRKIRTGNGADRLRPRHLLDVHVRHRAAIEATLATPFDGPTVVVTHHPPSPQSLQDGRVTDPLDAAYASDLEAVIRAGTPDLWIHGHVHRRRDYEIGGTRVMANPRGYVGWRKSFGQGRVDAEVEGFDETLVVRVGRDHKPKVVWEHGHEVLDLDELELAAWEEEHRAATRRAQSAHDKARHAGAKARGCGR